MPLLTTFGGGSKLGFEIKRPPDGDKASAVDLYSAITAQGGATTGAFATEVVVYELPSVQTLQEYITSFGLDETAGAGDTGSWGTFNNTPLEILNLYDSAGVTNNTSSFFKGNLATDLVDTDVKLKVWVTDQSATDTNDYTIFGFGDHTLNTDWSGANTSYGMMNELEWIGNEAQWGAGGIFGLSADDGKWYPLIIYNGDTNAVTVKTAAIFDGFSTFVTSGSGVYSEFENLDIERVAFGWCETDTFLDVGVVEANPFQSGDIFTQAISTITDEGTGSVTVAKSDLCSTFLRDNSTGTNLQVRDTEWILVKLIAASNQTGSRRIVVRNTVDSSSGSTVAGSATTVAVAQFSDVQIAAYQHLASDGTVKGSFFFSGNRTHSWQFAASTSNDSIPTSWTSISASVTATSDQWTLKVDGGATTSSHTGNLRTPSFSWDDESIFSYIYSESSSTAYGSRIWARSRTHTVAEGDYFLFVVGQHAPQAASLHFSFVSG